MVILVSLILSLAMPEESLRFSAAREQETDRGCGPAAAASLLSIYCGVPAAESGILADIASFRRRGARSGTGSDGPSAGSGAAGGVTLADLVAALEGRGLRARPYLMGSGDLVAALKSGYAPAIVHCREGIARDGGHFSLLIGAECREDGVLLVLADPLLGLIVRSEAEFAARWSGAAILVDPDAIVGEGRARLEAAMDRALGKRRLLEAIAAGWGG
jgi:predicted double-glycine peptidase